MKIEKKMRKTTLGLAFGFTILFIGNAFAQKPQYNITSDPEKIKEVIAVMARIDSLVLGVHTKNSCLIFPFVSLFKLQECPNCPKGNIGIPDASWITTYFITFSIKPAVSFLSGLTDSNSAITVVVGGVGQSYSLKFDESSKVLASIVGIRGYMIKPEYNGKFTPWIFNSTDILAFNEDPKIVAKN